LTDNTDAELLVVPRDRYDLATARELCAAIARYDKLRLVLEDVPSSRIVGLLLTTDRIAGEEDCTIGAALNANAVSPLPCSGVDYVAAGQRLRHLPRPPASHRRR
jgi:hypothetical protein